MRKILDNPKEFLDNLSEKEFELLLKEFEFKYEDISECSDEVKKIKIYFQNLKINAMVNKIHLQNLETNLMINKIYSQNLKTNFTVNNIYVYKNNNDIEFNKAKICYSELVKDNSIYYNYKNTKYKEKISANFNEDISLGAA